MPIIELLLTSKLRVLINLVEVESFEESISGLKVIMKSGKVYESTMPYEILRQNLGQAMGQPAKPPAPPMKTKG